MQFPRGTPRRSGLLAVGGGQQLYWEESGTPDGLPALYLHGGPGGGLGTGGYRTKFDPQRFRVVGFDQRGCGRSVPLASDPAHDLAANTTPQLVADIEALRVHLGIDAWLVNGVSWGSTLAIAYAQAHPDRVLGVVLMAVTTTSAAEVEWITETVGAIFPEEWDRFAAHAEAAGIGYRRGEGRLVDAYARLLRDPDPTVRDAASWAWARWEDVHVSLGLPEPETNPRWADPEFRLPFVTLATHYWAHDGFVEPPLLDGMERIGHLPAVLIHGRADVSGPVRTAWEVHHRWPASELVIVPDEGHGGMEMVEAWSDALSRLADRMQR
ncbi:MAG: prolyl aminopeptidase [Propionicimonas sp.]|uniref:prolyl aminopeptidase n=1 Tax=Propionicimonas sp. TaxID=1955623 RepID=UPI003D0F42DD